jgi:hypothetical protein
VRTGSIDSGRRPVARGRDEEDETRSIYVTPSCRNCCAPSCARWWWAFARIACSNIPAAAAAASARLRLPVHAGRGGGVYRPPRVPANAARRLAARARDELIGAFLRQAGTARGEGGRRFLVSAGKELARALVMDPQRLNAILLRMRQ